VEILGSERTLLDPPRRNHTFAKFELALQAWLLFSFLHYYITVNILNAFLDPEMNAIVMQQRALQACTSCRKLKRKCTYNPTLGKCDRCFESGKPCVYAEVNSTAPQSGSDAGPGPSATSTNAVPSSSLMAASHQHNLALYPGSFDASSVASDIVYIDQRNALSDGSRMASMGSGNEYTTHPSSNAGRQF